MQLEISYKRLAEMSESLNRMVEVDMPAKYAFRMQKVMKQLQEELTELNSQRESLIRKYGEEVNEEQGKTVRVKSDMAEKFWEEWSEVLDETITIKYTPLPLSLIQNSEVKIADMAALADFIYDDLGVDETEMDEAEEKETEESQGKEVEKQKESENTDEVVQEA